MTTLRRMVLTGQMNERDAELVRIKSARDWELAWIMGVALLLAGVLVGGLIWTANRDSQGWQREAVKGGKQDRAGNVGSRFVLNQKE